MKLLTNYHQIESARQRQQRDSERQRMSDVSRIANQLCEQTPGLTRTDALKLAENAIPHTL